MNVLLTDRVRLRRLSLGDTDRLLEALGDPVAMQHYPAPKDRDGVERWIRWAMESYEANGFGLWAIERLGDGAFLGDCGPMLQPVGDAVLPEIGYHLVRREWGKGYATEAASAALAWVFRETAHDRACSIVSPANEPSRRVAARIHHALEMFTWVRTGTDMCLYSTTRSQLDEPTLAERDEPTLASAQSEVCRCRADVVAPGAEDSVGGLRPPISSSCSLRARSDR